MPPPGESDLVRRIHQRSQVESPRAFTLAVHPPSLVNEGSMRILQSASIFLAFKFKKIREAKRGMPRGGTVELEPVHDGLQRQVVEGTELEAPSEV